jgi:hypothetical protein
MFLILQKIRHLNFEKPKMLSDQKKRKTVKKKKKRKGSLTVKML